MTALKPRAANAANACSSSARPSPRPRHGARTPSTATWPKPTSVGCGSQSAIPASSSPSSRETTGPGGRTAAGAASGTTHRTSRASAPTRPGTSRSASGRRALHRRRGTSARRSRRGIGVRTHDLPHHAIALGAHGTLYVTDSILGAIWRIRDGRRQRSGFGTNRSRVSPRSTRSLSERMGSPTTGAGCWLRTRKGDRSSRFRSRLPARREHRGSFRSSGRAGTSMESRSTSRATCTSLCGTERGRSPRSCRRSGFGRDGRRMG